MSSLARQSFMSGFCFAASQSFLDLGSSTQEKIFMVSAHVIVTAGTASFTGDSRQRFTRTSAFHHGPQRDGSRSATDLKWRSITILLRLNATAPLGYGNSTASVLRSPPPYADPFYLHPATLSTGARDISLQLFPCFESSLQLCSRSVRTYMGCSISELFFSKSQSAARMSISSRRSPSSSFCQRGSVSLLGGCLTSMLLITTIFSLPPCATIIFASADVLLSSAARSMSVKRNLGEPCAADISPTLSSTWARPKLFLKGVSLFLISLNVNFSERTKLISCFEALVLVIYLSMTLGGFTEALIQTSLRTMLYLSCLKRTSSLWSLVGSLAPSLKTFLMRSVTSPAIKQMNLPKSLTVLLSCGAARTGSEDATDFVSTIFRGVDRLSTSRHTVTKFRTFGFAVNSSLTHSSCSLNSLSIYLRGFSISIIYVVLSLCTVSRARIVVLSKCNPND